MELMKGQRTAPDKTNITGEGKYRTRTIADTIPILSRLRTPRITSDPAAEFNENEDEIQLWSP
jgi:hypothetical protein